MPTMQDMTKFLQSRCQVLEAIASSSANMHEKPQNQGDTKKAQSKHNHKYQMVSCASYQLDTRCPICHQNHHIARCNKFLQLDTRKRSEEVKKLGLCFNCLRTNHQLNQCVASNCRLCQGRHNTLLHQDKQEQPPQGTSASTQESRTVTTTHCSSQSLQIDQVVLSTAVLQVFDIKGQPHVCRALLDSGSQSNFMTKRLAESLGLKQTSINIPVIGINHSHTTINSSVVAKIKSRYNQFQANLTFLTLRKITEQLPQQQIHREDLRIPANLNLADPDFHKSSEIDMLIGAELFYSLLCVGQIRTSNKLPTLQKTQLGWIVSGRIHNQATTQGTSCNLSTGSLNTQITKFWEIEEYESTKRLSPEESECERHFQEHFQRDQSGRYTVRLPFRENKEQLGESFNTALKRFYSMERKLNHDPTLKQQYTEFLQEYQDLNHMEEIQQEATNNSGYFLPHHAVVKADSLTTKTRVVFDGSAKTSSGISLNDTLMIGPTIQDDLVSIITRFRYHKVVITADIEKMYRQVQVHQDDTQYQKILWRKENTDPVKVYRLKTVTYGLASAPFLAIRCLHQLAEEGAGRHPLAAAVLKRDFYVDDLLTGANSIEAAIVLRDQLLQLLQEGGFHLRKWASNAPEVLRGTSSTSTDEHLQLDTKDSIKTLGLQWDAQQDTIMYTVHAPEDDTNTKRCILSQISRLFDPLGLLGPIIVKAKIIMQRLWQIQAGWDESFPIEVHTAWNIYKQELPAINKLRISRYLGTNDAIKIQLHGFCDASETAYGACLFLRTTSVNDSHSVTLVCSKSRVAPLKQLTLPRLELCAAVLLARLYNVTCSALSIPIQKTHFWSDSTITLAWINTPPHTLKTFVANRVTEIQSLTNSQHWRHVSSQDNPADIISRGKSASELISTKIWWNGPSWLEQSEHHWPHGQPQATEIIEMKQAVTLTSINNSKANLLNKFSSFTKMQRVTAYCIRFARNCREKNKQTGALSCEELQTATTRIIKQVQQEEFPRELQSLQDHKPINSKSKIQNLNPFVDNEGILRVGGRLKHANLLFNQKHPILLPRAHTVTKLIIKHEHIKQLHAGVQATLYAVRQRYWPIDGRNTTRRIIHQCIKCFRINPPNTEHIMGNLPRTRTESCRPFTNTGVDYAGPFYIKEKRLRNRNKIKVYAAIFVCFATKAVHIELVSDLTTEACLAALRRFFARRGKARHIHSDNGTNFSGAANELTELYALLKSQAHQDQITQQLAGENVVWHFTPPRSPHFGGLWEAAVKSFKYHLRRVVGDALFTFEELYTYMVEIEAVLNSRPLIPLSSDPNDFLALTPGHFLIGDPLTSIPSSDLTTIPANRLSSWQRIQQIKQHFWTRWHKEYLNELQIRNKWQSHNQSHIKVGTMVVLKEENVPPMRWVLGRITEVHPGSDQIIRVASVKTSKGVFKRSIKKMCILPLPEEDSIQ